MKLNLPVTNRELEYRKNAIIISTTDCKGVITDANEDFVEISGFTREELIGKSHNIVRHPDMPPAAFANLWETVKQGKLWNGIVKNRSKNGDHYWVEANVTPIVENGQITGYVSVRTTPSRQRVEQAAELYRAINAGEVKKIGSWIDRIRNSSLKLKLWMVTGLVGVLPLGGWLLGVSPLATAIGSLVLTLGIVPLVIGLIVRPLNELRATMMAIQGGGDLSRRAVVHGDDEVGQAAKAFNALILTLRGITSEIRGHVLSLSQASGDLSTAANSVNGNVGTQVSASQASAAAVEQLVASVNSVADLAKHVRDDAQASLVHTRKGNEDIAGVVAQIDQIEHLVKSTADSVHNFVDSVHSITAMTQQVKDIAEQTNLLALNAAIEAARAGEQGRGFAVVADEVRKLAEKSAASAKEIESVTHSIENQSAAVESSVQAGLKQLGEMLDAMEAFSEIMAASSYSVAQAAEGVDGIGHATAEQSQATYAIAQEIERIASMAENTAQVVSQSLAAAQSVETISGALGQAVNRFKG